MSGGTRMLVAFCLVGGAVAAGVGVRLYQEPLAFDRPGGESPAGESSAGESPGASASSGARVPAAGTPTTFPQLSVGLERSGGRLLVTNLDDHPWTGCFVDINAGVPGGGFSRALGGVDPGAQGAMDLDAFARADGRHFDPGAERVQVVDVHCDTPSGQAHFTGGVPGGS